MTFLWHFKILFVCRHLATIVGKKIVCYILFWTVLDFYDDFYFDQFKMFCNCFRTMFQRNGPF